MRTSRWIQCSNTIRTSLGFLLAGVFLAIASPVSAMTYYTDPANGTNCPCTYPTVNNNGTCGTSGNPFSCVSDGVTKAAPGDTVSAASGTYNECVLVWNKTNITVQAQVSRGAIIQHTDSHAACQLSSTDSAKQNTVEISGSNGILFKSFKVTGSRAVGIIISGTGSGNEINDVEAYGNAIGILFYVGGNTLRVSSAHNNKESGIAVSGAAQVNLDTDSSTYNGGGGLLVYPGSNQAIISNLTASNNTAMGVYLASDQNSITTLTSDDNHGEGMIVVGSNNTLLGGEFARNRLGMIFTCTTPPCTSTPAGNHFTAMDVHHNWGGPGVKLDGGVSTWIDGSRVHHNAYDGILETHDASSSIIEGNEFDNNGGLALPASLPGHGLYLGGNSSTIRGNKVHDNAGWGIHLWAAPWGTPSSHYIIEHNDVYRNSSGVVLGGGNGPQPSLRELPQYTEIRYNTIHHNRNIGFWYELSTCTGVNNVGNTFHHNTVVYNDAVDGSQVIFSNAQDTQLLFKDNIVIGDTTDYLLKAYTSNVSPNATDGNVFYRENSDSGQPNLFLWNDQLYTSLSGLQGGITYKSICPENGGTSAQVEARSSYAAPVFLDGTMNRWQDDSLGAPYNGNFHLMPGSPGTAGGVCCAETIGGDDIDGETPTCSPADCSSAATGAGADYFRNTDGDSIANKYDCNPNSALDSGICDGDTAPSPEGTCPTIASYDRYVNPSATEMCDGKDNNCDGSMLSGGEADVDRDGYFSAASGCAPDFLDCDDTDPRRHPGAEEICDGKDNECNGVVDDMGSAICGVGACQVTINNCVGGALQTCTPGTPGTEGLSATGTCFDGIDNDCDGYVDSDCGANIDFASGELAVIGSVSSGAYGNLSATSAGNTYETFDEAQNGGSYKLTFVWTITNPAGGLLYDLGIEGYRVHGNDTFVFSKATRSSGTCTSSESWSSNFLTLAKTQDDDALVRASMDTSGPVTCIRVRDTVTSGDATQDSLALDRLLLFPTPVADSETVPNPGSIQSGSRSNTFTSDDSDEAIVETQVGSGYQLTQTWKFENVPPGSSHQLNLEGHRSSTGGDKFQFSYSTDNVNFTNISGAEIKTTAEQQGGGDYTFGGSTLSGTVWIRAKDESTTNSSPTILYLDRLVIKTRQP